MKLAKLMLTTTGVIAVLPLAARNRGDHHKHHHYKLIVLGTLGGRQSWG